MEGPAHLQDANEERSSDCRKSLQELGVFILLLNRLTAVCFFVFVKHYSVSEFFNCSDCHSQNEFLPDIAMLSTQTISDLVSSSFHLAAENKMFQSFQNMQTHQKPLSQSPRFNPKRHTHPRTYC